MTPKPTCLKTKIKNKFYDLQEEHSDDELGHFDVVVNTTNLQEPEEALEVEDLIEFPTDDDEEEQVSLTENCSNDSKAVVSSEFENIDLPGVWSPGHAQQVALSPIIQNEADADFGHIIQNEADADFGKFPLDWDHSSDLSTPMYDVEEETYRLAQTVAEDALEYEDDVFDDATLLKVIQIIVLSIYTSLVNMFNEVGYTGWRANYQSH